MLSTDASLPSIVFSGKFKKEAFIQVQNTPLTLHGRMVNFCLLPIDTPYGYSSEGYAFNKGDVFEGRVEIYLNQ